jgi:hypothetical protein
VDRINECEAVAGMREIGGETEILLENLLQFRCVHHKSRTIGPETAQAAVGTW